MTNSRIALGLLHHRLFGATLLFTVFLTEGNSKVENSYIIVKQFFWRKSKAQVAFNFAERHNPFQD